MSGTSVEGREEWVIAENPEYVENAVAAEKREDEVEVDMRSVSGMGPGAFRARASNVLWSGMYTALRTLSLLARPTAPGARFEPITGKDALVDAPAAVQLALLARRRTESLDTGEEEGTGVVASCSTSRGEGIVASRGRSPEGLAVMRRLPELKDRGRQKLVLGPTLERCLPRGRCLLGIASQAGEAEASPASKEAADPGVAVGSGLGALGVAGDTGLPGTTKYAYMSGGCSSSGVLSATSSEAVSPCPCACALATTWVSVGLSSSKIGDGYEGNTKAEVC